MLRTIEKAGKTVDEAVGLAIEELKLDKDSVDIEILDEGNKGLFGIIGTKMARVKVSEKERNKNSIVQRFMKEIFDTMDLNVQVDLKEEAKDIYVDLKGDNMGILIGRRGETLDALQYIVNIVVNKDNDDYRKVVIDIENYRKKREETLVRLANKVAERVVRLKKSVTLEPMNPYERRIIHSALQQNRKISTYSVGDEPNRKVVIALK